MSLSTLSNAMLQSKYIYTIPIIYYESKQFYEHKLIESKEVFIDYIFINF